MVVTGSVISFVRYQGLKRLYPTAGVRDYPGLQHLNNAICNHVSHFKFHCLLFPGCVV